MLYETPITQILFIDIETVPQVYRFEDLNEKGKNLWKKKANYLIKKEEDTPESVYERAGIYAEFGKIICISAAYIHQENNEDMVRMKSYYGDDEKSLLEEFFSALEKLPSGFHLCGHNAKEFDIPYLCRRGLVNGLRLPSMLNLSGKKPWEVHHLDTLDLWKFGDYKHYTSLEQLAYLFDIPTPKDDIDGSQVKRVYYEENDIDRIVKYCEKDVLTVVNLFRKFRGLEIIGNFETR
jgi:3'-5' exonuclease